MFRQSSLLLSESAQNKLEDKNSWNQILYSNFVSKVDESIFSVLYAKKKGRPNASIRIMLGMMLIKELQGWSDEQLFDECVFNLRVRSALGIYHVDQGIPAASTYYDFRSKIEYYKIESREDLIEQTFHIVSAYQIKDLEISGVKIRMDSKLIQSNIARLNRLQFILETLRKHVEKVDILPLEKHLEEGQYKLLDSLSKQTTSNITYKLNKEQKEAMLISLGQLIKKLIDLGYVDDQSVLHKVFEQQYDLKQSDDDDNDPPHITLKPSKEISSNSIQSVHDKEARYRRKGKGQSKQEVQGYHCNIAETYGEENKPGLILDVITKPANVSECDFLQPAIKRIEEKLIGKNKISDVVTDGGYDSKSNREAMVESPINWKLQKLKGNKHTFKMTINENEQLQVRDIKTDELLEVAWSDVAQKHVIRKTDGSRRYIDKQKVEEYIQASKILGNSKESDKGARANVEATIHEVFHRLFKRNKIKYRRQIKCHWYAIMRAMAVNIGRIQRYLEIDLLLSLLVVLSIYNPSTIKKL